MKPYKQWEKYLLNRLHCLASRKFDGNGRIHSEEIALVRGINYCMDRRHLKDAGENVMYLYIGFLNDKELFPKREKKSRLEYEQ